MANTGVETLVRPAPKRRLGIKRVIHIARKKKKSVFEGYPCVSVVTYTLEED